MGNEVSTNSTSGLTRHQLVQDPATHVIMNKLYDHKTASRTMRAPCTTFEICSRGKRWILANKVYRSQVIESMSTFQIPHVDRTHHLSLPRSVSNARISDDNTHVAAGFGWCKFLKISNLHNCIVNEFYQIIGCAMPTCVACRWTNPSIHPHCRGASPAAKCASPYPRLSFGNILDIPSGENL